ncbi:MAG TPA: hypothetical protein VN650_04460 [Gemmatimonadaceae bacterium]|nr:hypothetical protein [Gemmatimonadaceae bacterium]
MIGARAFRFWVVTGVLVVFAGITGAATMYRAYRAHRDSEQAAAIQKQLGRLAAPARRSTPVSLRTDRR